MGYQKFKLKTANTVISAENSAMQTMATESVVDLFSLGNQEKKKKAKNPGKGVQAVLDSLPELWDQDQYEKEYDVENQP